MTFRTCDVDALAGHLRTLQPGSVGVSGEVDARTGLLADELRSRLPGTALVDGALLFEGGDGDRFDTRVWMEESRLHLIRAAQRAERAAGRRWQGRWSASPPVVDSSDRAAQVVRERQRDRADAVFVVLGGWPGRVRLRFFADYADFALWDDEGHGGEVEELLPLGDDLRRRIRRWAVAEDRTTTPEEAERQREEALSLVGELRERLGPGYRVDGPC